MKKGFLTKTIRGRRIEHIACPHPDVPFAAARTQDRR